MKKFLKNNFITILVLSTYLVLALKFFRFIIRFNQNLLFWDQWDIFDYVVGHKNLVDMFLYQHNEHRIFVGLIFVKALAYVSDWNVYTETLSTGIIITISCTMALFIKKRLTKHIEIYDIFIPFLFFNLYQYENLIWGFQVMYTLPLLFMMLAACCFTYKYSKARNLILIVVALLSAYSHFHGLFVTIISAIFFLMSAFYEKSSRRHEYITYFLLTLAIVLSYFIGYRQAKFLGQEHFNLANFAKYIIFEINSFLGNHSKTFISLIIPISALFFFFKTVRELATKTNLAHNFPTIALYLFSFLFLISTALGRSGIGLEGAYTSRYVTMLIPAYFAIYLSLSQINFKARNSILVLVLVFFVLFSSQNNHFNYIYAQNHKNNLNNWLNCYLKKEDLNFCTKNGIIIYHSPEKINLEEKINYLREHRLNFFQK